MGELEQCTLAEGERMTLSLGRPPLFPTMTCLRPKSNSEKESGEEGRQSEQRTSLHAKRRMIRREIPGNGKLIRSVLVHFNQKLVEMGMILRLEKKGVREMTPISVRPAHVFAPIATILRMADVTALIDTLGLARQIHRIEDGNLHVDFLR